MKSSEEILSSYLQPYENTEDYNRFSQMIKALLNAESGTIVSPLSYYIDFLEQTDELLLNGNYLINAFELRQKLKIAYLLLLNNKANKQKYRGHLAACERLIDILDCYAEDNGAIRAQTIFYSDDAKPIKYLGIAVGQFVGERIIEFTAGSAQTIVDWMSAINEKRLYWVWGGGLLRTVLGALPDDFLNNANAKGVANAPTRFFGYMSWVLYYARFSLNLLLVLKNTFAPELTQEEIDAHQYPRWERFKTQWDERKYLLLNDLLWGVCNMVCFLWWTGAEGDAYTTVLLVFDLCSALYEYEEEQTKFLKKMNYFDAELTMARNQLRLANTDEEKQTLHTQIKDLENDKIKCYKEWQQKKLVLLNASAYAFTLIITFVLYTMPFMPFAAPTLLIITAIGAALCFAITVINNSIKVGLDIRNASLTRKQKNSDLNDKITQFIAIFDENDSMDDSKKMLLFLEIKQLSCDSEVQRRLVQYHTATLIRAILLQSLIPSLLFFSFVLFPFGTGFAITATVLAIALVTHAMIEYMKPKPSEFSEFDNEEYEQFCNNPGQWRIKPEPAQHRLFSPANDGFESDGERGYLLENDELGPDLS